MRGDAGEYRRDVPHGLMFHRFHPDGIASGWQGALSAEDFERILIHAGVERMLAPDVWVERLEAGALKPADLCLTFDDGLRSQMAHALPVMEKHGLRAFWFAYSSVFDGRPVKSEIYSYAAARAGGMDAIVSEFLERCPADLRAEIDSPAFEAYAAGVLAQWPFYSRRDLEYRFLRNNPAHRVRFEALMDGVLESRGMDVQALAGELWMAPEDFRTLAEAGHWVGLHSHDHPYAMAALSKAEQQDQYETNYARLAAASGSRPQSMSHPLNSYNDDSLAVLAELGIRCGFRSNMSPPPGKSVNAGPLELAREDSITLLHITNEES